MRDIFNLRLQKLKLFRKQMKEIFKKIDKGVLSANNSVWVVKSNKPIKIGKLKEEIIKIIK